MLELGALPDEIVQEIVRQLDAIDPGAVVSLSLVSRAVRASCLGVLFETARFEPDAVIPEDAELPPLLDPAREDAEHLRRYVRTLVLVGSPALEIQEATLSILAQAIPHLSGLHTFRVQDSLVGIWQGLWDLLSTSIPHLARLELHSAAWTACPQMLCALPSSFASVSYGHARAPPPEYQESMLAETRALNTFLLIHGARLARLALPAELAMLAFLRGQPWPALRALSLHGYPPVRGGAASSDLVAFLGATPALRALRVDLARTKTALPFVVFDPLDNETTVPPGFLAGLHTFSLTRPERADRIFHHLPRALHTLELLAYPRPTRFRTSEDIAPPPVPCAEMLRMLGASALPDLRVLRVAVAAPFDRAFVDGLADMYPLLEVLELQELRQQDVVVDAREHTMTLADGLAPLVRLRELRLQDLTYIAVPDDAVPQPAPPAPADVWASPFYNVARTLGVRVHSLRHVVFLGGYACEEVCRVEMRVGEVITFWQAPDAGAEG